MKSKASVRRICASCRPVKRRGRTFIVCSASQKVLLHFQVLRWGPQCHADKCLLLQHKQRRAYSTTAGPAADTAQQEDHCQQLTVHRPQPMQYSFAASACDKPLSTVGLRPAAAWPGFAFMQQLTQRHM